MRFMIPRGKGRSFAALSLVVLAVAILVTAISYARTAARRAQSVENLKQIGRALHKYEEDHERLPGPIRSKDGTSLLSWRVAILPYLDGQALYAEFHLDEPWDSPHNRPLLNRMPAVFAIPGSPAAPGMTFYRGFYGRGALFDPADKDGPTFASITDGLSNTAAIVEARQAVPWTCPDNEIPFNKQEDKTGDAVRSQIGGHFPGGADLLLVDGAVHFLKDTMRSRNVKALITRNGEESIVGEDTSDGTKADTDFESNKSLFAAIKAENRFLLYEGLPHQEDERELLQAEKSNKATVTLQGFPFYKIPLEISAADQETLQTLIEDERSFREWRGDSMCSVFHPDYLAEWRVRGASYQFLICFGCHEVKAFGPDQSLRCSIKDEAFKTIQHVLMKYVKNRPRQTGS